ncbi:putative RNA-binding Zn-ribbon protein involved in translation (DUF1610 family) [Bradyrhizobium sp. USDA 4518]
MSQYRYLAKKALSKATKLLKSDDADDLTYGCLELRKCIEALSYDLLTGYLSEVPLKAMETWQPDKVMKELLRIDPTADHSSHIRMRREGENGKPDGNWKYLGEDRRMKAPWAAKAYHQLGSYLHVPTIKQERDGRSFDVAAARARAEEIRAELSRILGASIWNANFSVSVTFACAECETPMKRRESVLKTKEPIECGHCGQLHDAELQADGRYFIVPHSFSWECAVCHEPRTIKQSRAKDGVDVSCPKCGDKVTLRAETQLLLSRAAEEPVSGGTASGEVTP